MRVVTRESSQNEPHNELDSVVTSLAVSLDSMGVPAQSAAVLFASVYAAWKRSIQHAKVVGAVWLRHAALCFAALCYAMPCSVLRCACARVLFRQGREQGAVHEQLDVLKNKKSTRRELGGPAAYGNQKSARFAVPWPRNS